MKRFSALMIFLVAVAMGAVHSMAETPESEGNTVPSANEPVDLTNLEVPLEEPSNLLLDATGKVRSALKRLEPSRRGKRGSMLTKEGAFVLYGDLFGTGESYAVMEVRPVDPDAHGAMALARWSDGKWVICGLWNITPTWRPKGEKEYMPIDHPAERPFEVVDFGGGAPCLVVAGDVYHYFQEYYLFRFDAAKHTIVPRGYAMAAPQYEGGYVRLVTGSGHRAIWGESGYYHWSGGQLVKVASWHDETPYNNIDPEFWVATRYDAKGTKQVYTITYGESNSDKREVYEIRRGTERFAEVTIIPHNLPREWNDSQCAYFFEKLTGLPRKLYPPEREENASPVILENNAVMRVKGLPEAVKMLDK